MHILRSIAEAQAQSRAWIREANSIALVPTMGALHRGHISLVEHAGELADRTVVSIFVNPKQFGPGEDFEAYPRHQARDIEQARDAGAAAVFIPKTDDVYPPDHQTWVVPGELSTALCGANRPGHFRGVTTICSVLFHATLPDFAVFGEKDYQQLAIIRRMVRDLHFPLQIVGVPTIREPDGLAMSSRNAYLSTANRLAAASIPRALARAQGQVAAGETDAEALIAEISKEMSESGGIVDYVSVVDPISLQAVVEIGAEVVVAVAVHFGGTRLIDNARLTPPSTPS